MPKAEDEVGAATPEVLTTRGTPVLRRTEEDRGATSYGCPVRRRAATPLFLLSILLPLLLLSGNVLGQQLQKQSKQPPAVKKPARPGRAKTVTDLFNTTSCADPPYRCPYPRIEFYLYTRSTQEEPEKLDLLKSAGPTLMETHFDAAHPTKIVIHGFGGGRKLSPSPDMRKAYFTRGEHNVIIVDYSSLVVEPCLSQVEWGPRFCALCIAQLIGWLDDGWRWSIKSLISANRVTRQVAASWTGRRRDFNDYLDFPVDDYGDAEPSAPAEDGNFGQRVVQSVGKSVGGARGLAGDARGSAGDARGSAGDARVLAGTARGLAGNARGLAGDARGLTGDARGLAGDERVLRVLAEDERRMAGNARGLAGDARGSAGDARGSAGDARVLAGTARGLAGNTRGLTGDARGLTGDEKVLAKDERRMAGDARGLAGEARGLTGDARGLTGDARRLVGVARGLTGDARGLAGEARRLAGNSRGLAGDARGSAGDARGLTGDARGLTGDARRLVGVARGLTGDARGLTGDARESAGDARRLVGVARGGNRGHTGDVGGARGRGGGTKGGSTQGRNGITRDGVGLGKNSGVRGVDNGSARGGSDGSDRGRSEADPRLVSGGARENDSTAAPRRLRFVGSPPEGVHVIGYSVGAHIAGLLANYVGERKIGRITGLDPTIIFYMGSNRSRDLDPTDALFVDVIHTGAGVLGQWGPNGHVDFYVNGGTSQPGCTGGIYETLACDHQKVTPYFIESITSQRGFWATPCSNLLLYLIGWCSSTEESKLIKMGEDVPHSARGIYYLETNARKPYAKGLPSDSTRRKRQRG